MEALNAIVQKLDSFFALEEMEPDPGFSRFIPLAYADSNFDWKTRFEPSFVHSFNGLMLRGADTVETVFLSVFPTPEVLEQFLAEARAGDLLFLHHPLDMECGDPRGSWGRGFYPIDAVTLESLTARRLSIYTLHAPLDIHPTLSTSRAIAEALDVRVDDGFYRYSSGFAGLIGDISPLSTEALCQRLLVLFELPYLDIEGATRATITRIAVAAGVADKVAIIQEAERKGAQAYVAGEIHVRIEGEYGRTKYKNVQEYARTSAMSLLGVSHSASEYLVMKTHMAPWFQQHFKVETRLIPLERWWR
jgi:putative NIF3 family GTP cyclohydrolase 1 type 2